MNQPATEVKERPILFNGEMVRSILEGRKLNTRRVIKPQPEYDGYWLSHGCYSANGEAAFRDGSPFFCKCPYGKPGDRLWVREAFDVVDDPAAYHPDDGEREPSGYNCKDAIRRGEDGQRLVVDYKADDNGRIMDKVGTRKWKPSIHMPRWASRITLEITDVRVERVQEIMSSGDVMKDFCPPRHLHESFLESFVGYDNERKWCQKFWDSINAKRGFSWESNPFVWVVSFKRLESNSWTRSY